MSSLLIVLLVIGAVAVLVASAALVSMLQRRDVLLRATDDQAFEGASVVLRPEKAQASKLRARLEEWAKTRKQNDELQHKLIQGGFESSSAPAIFFLLRSASMVLFPLLAFLLIPRTEFFLFASTVAVAVFTGRASPAGRSAR